MFQTLISSATVGAGGVTSVTFSSIPQTYTDLTLVISGRSALAAVTSGQYIRFNSDATGGNYAFRALFGNGATASVTGSIYGFLGNGVGASATASTFGNALIFIPNYTNALKKIFSVDLVGENNAATAEQRIVAGSWNSTAAISTISVNFEDEGSNTVQYSTVYLYGTLKGSGGATVS